MALSYAVSRVLRRSSNLFLQTRHESTMASLTKDEILILLRPPFTNWSNVIREAEKVVGYPTSFMNLRCLLSDEFANMALYLRKLVGSNHLVMQTAKNVLYGDSKNLQPWGLIILLLSKSIKTAPLQAKKVEEHQRVLAELTEMIRTGHLIHRGIVNVPFQKRTKNSQSAIFGNKIAILLGDYLLVTANAMLAGMRNSDVSYIISTALKDLSEGEFFGERDEQNMPLPGKPKMEKMDKFETTFDTSAIRMEDVLGNPRKEWTTRTVFNGVSLLGRGCQSAMVLGKQSREIQNQAYYFGCHLGLAWQAATEIQKLTSDSKEQFCLASAPVLFALDDNPDLYKIIDQAKNDVKDVDYEDLKFNILKTDAVEKTKKLYEDHAKKATLYIENIGQNKSVDMIKKLINTF